MLRSLVPSAVIAEMGGRENFFSSLTRNKKPPKGSFKEQQGDYAATLR